MLSLVHKVRLVKDLNLFPMHLDTHRFQDHHFSIYHRMLGNQSNDQLCISHLSRFHSIVGCSNQPMVELFRHLTLKQN